MNGQKGKNEPKAYEESLAAAVSLASDGKVKEAYDMVMSTGNQTWSNDPDAVILVFHLLVSAGWEDVEDILGYCKKYIDMSFGENSEMFRSSGIVQKSAPDPEYVVEAISLILYNSVPDAAEKEFYLGILTREEVYKADINALVHAGALAFELGKFDISVVYISEFFKNSSDSMGGDDENLSLAAIKRAFMIMALSLFCLGKNSAAIEYISIIREQGIGLYSDPEPDSDFEEADGCENASFTNTFSGMSPTGTVVKGCAGQDEVSVFGMEALLNSLGGDKNAPQERRQNIVSPMSDGKDMAPVESVEKATPVSEKHPGQNTAEKESGKKTVKMNNPKVFQSVIINPDGSFYRVMQV